MLRLVLTLVAFVGMVALCVILWPYGGWGGLIGAGLGFFLRLWGRGLDWGERLGNAYVGALMGLPVGLLLGGFYALGVPALIDAINAPPEAPPVVAPAAEPPATTPPPQ